jgi:N-acyl-D-aspartate/D-glutamate deacylase
MQHLALLLVLALQQPTPVDVLIRGGTVHDGSGNPPRITDVGIRGDRIAFMGDAAAARVTGTRTIEARGLIVAPGFIDPHNHVLAGVSGSASAERRQAASALTQGITTVTISPDGRGPIDIAQTMTELGQAGVGPNVYALVGFGTVRQRVLGNSSAPATPAQVDSMRALIDRAMREGAFGVGAGLFYAPQSYSTTEEVIRVVSVAKPYGGVYDSHQRDESSYSMGLMNSVREAIRIGRESGLTTNIGHVKALGVDVWGYADSVLRLMREARAQGHMVVADQYPWTASGTGLSAALVPRWAQAGGRDSLRARLADAATRERVLVEMRDNLRRRGGDSTLLLIGGGANARPYIGKTLRDVATERDKPAVEAALEMIETGLDMSVASFNMTEQDIETFMKDPFVMTGSDGSGGHPRAFGTYPRKIRRYVLDKPVITMARMVQASSAQVAEVYGIPQRGRLTEGFFADVIVFDPTTIREMATYVEPELPSVGMRWVFVNGREVVADGRLTATMAGRGIRKGQDR